MDTIILAGGYAERLYPLTENKAKALLEVRKDGKPLLAYTLEELNRFYKRESGKCYLTVNKKFQPDFQRFLDSASSRIKFNLELVVEDSTPQTKPGTLGAITKTLDSCPAISQKHGLLIIAGDNLSSLRLSDLSYAYAKSTIVYSDYPGIPSSLTKPGTSVIAAYKIDNPKKARLYGCLRLGEMDGTVREVLGITEKPKHRKIGAFVNTTQFIFNYETITRLYEYLSKQPKEEFFNWLIKEKGVCVNAFIFDMPWDYWFDIGDKDSLEEARKFVEVNPSISSQIPSRIL